MSGKNRKYAGFLLIEIIVAMAVLGILLVGLALSLDGFRRFNRYQLVRQRCTAAAQAELESITATGKPIPEEDFKRLWPKLRVSTKQSAGSGQWEGMKLVEVTASGKSFRREVKVRLCRYVSADTIFGISDFQEMGRRTPHLLGSPFRVFLYPGMKSSRCGAKEGR